MMWMPRSFGRLILFSSKFELNITLLQTAMIRKIRNGRAKYSLHCGKYGLWSSKGVNISTFYLSLKKRLSFTAHVVLLGPKRSHLWALKPTTVSDLLRRVILRDCRLIPPSITWLSPVFVCYITLAVVGTRLYTCIERERINAMQSILSKDITLWQRKRLESHDSHDDIHRAYQKTTWLPQITFHSVL